MKPSKPKNGRDGCTTGTVTLLFCHIGFTADTDRFHHRARQSHHRHRVLNLVGVRCWPPTSLEDRPARRLEARPEPLEVGKGKVPSRERGLSGGPLMAAERFPQPQEHETGVADGQVFGPVPNLGGRPSKLTQHCMGDCLQIMATGGVRT